MKWLSAFLICTTAFMLYFMIPIENEYGLAQENPYPPITIYNVNQLSHIRTIGYGTIADLVWSADGEQLFIAGSLGIWRYSMATDMFEHLQFTSRRTIAISPDGMFIASGSTEGDVFLLNIETGDEQVINHHENGTNTVAFSHDGTLLASGGWDFTVRIWNLEQHIEQMTLRHANIVTDITFDPNDQLLISAGADKTVRFWDVGSGEEQSRIFVNESIASIAINSTGTQLLTGGYDFLVRLWDVASGEMLQTMDKHSFSVNAVDFSPDGTLMASGGGDRTVRIWDASSGQAETVLDESGTITTISFSPDGSELAVGVLGDLIIYDVANDYAYRRIQGFMDPIVDFDIDLERSLLVTGGTQTVREWNVDSTTNNAIIIERQYVGTSVDISPNGSLIGSGGTYGMVSIWDRTTQNLLMEMDIHKEYVPTVVFSLDGTLLASGSWDGDIHILDVDRQSVIATLNDDKDVGGVYSLAFTQDGQYLAAGRLDIVQLWNVNNQTVEYSIDLDAGRNNAMVFVNHEQTLIIGTDYHSVRTWEVGSEEYHTYGSYQGTVNGVAANADETMIVSGGKDGVISVWDYENRTLITTLEGHNREVTDIMFTLDGTMLVSSSIDGTIRFWGILE